MLDADAELPLSAALAAPLEQRVAVLRAVRLDVRRDALFPASALGGRQTDRCAGRVEAERVASIAHAVLMPATEVGPPQMSPPLARLLLREVQQVAVDPTVAVGVGPGTRVAR